MASMTAQERRDVVLRKATEERNREAMYVAPPTLTPAQAAQRAREWHQVDRQRVEAREARKQRPAAYSDPELWGL